MKKFYAFAAAAIAALSMNAQNGAPLYYVGNGMVNGAAIGWEPGAPQVFNYDEATGVYTFEAKDLVEFKVSTTSGTWDEFNAGGYWAACSDKATLGTPVALEKQDNPGNIACPWKGDYKVVVSGDLATITLTTDTPEPVGPASVYIRGAVNDWGAPDLWKFETADNKTFWFDCTGETMIPAGVEWKIADADWGAVNYGYGDVVFPSEEGEYWNYNANNTTLAEDYTGTIKLVLPDVPRDPALITLFPTIVEHKDNVGVADINLDNNAPAVYYNLHGVRVDNPAQGGLYIKKQGDTVSKVIIR